jgi:hypothetical protein
MGSPPAPQALPTPAAPQTADEAAGKKKGPEGGKRLIWAVTLRAVRQWLCPWARVQLRLSALVQRCSAA